MVLGSGDNPGDKRLPGMAHLQRGDSLPEMLLVLVYPVLEVLRSVPNLSQVTVHPVHE